MSNYPPPQGPSQGYPPPSPEPPPVGTPAGSGGLGLGVGIAIGAAIALVFILLGAGLTFVLTRSDSTPQADNAVTVTTEPISTTTDPFTPPIAPAGEESTDVPVTDPVQTEEPITVEGGRVGLYGGTEKAGTCDKEKLINFLESSPDKAAGWATVVGVDTDQIRPFVSALTPLILRSDTRVTNHGWNAGGVTTVVSVLQAGTAVLVDDYGVPVVKCFCGNPLTPPPVIVEPTYVGPTWQGWNPQSVTIIEQNVTVINDYTVVNVINNQTFVRPVGTDGTADAPATNTGQSATPRPTTPEPSPSITNSETAAAAVKDAVLTGLRQCAARLGAADDLERNLKKYTFTAAPLSNASMWQVTAVGEGDTYKWNVNDQTGTVTAANPLAGELDGLCPEISDD